ncbi:MAG: Ribonuclease Y [Parcubacteria group bacterium GW2011_GWA2_43_13]|nr:MAG: Ribonuclease Y [Parcubacteria group bacterium GW2011_GWA2_43_13]
MRVLQWYSPMTPLFFIIAIIAVGIGGIIGYVYRKAIATRSVESAESKAEQILNEAKQKQKEVLIEAKDKALQIIEDAKKEEQQRRREIEDARKRLETREEMFDKKLLEIEGKHKILEDKSKQLDDAKAHIQTIREEQIAKLEKIAGLSMEDAKQILMENAEHRTKDELAVRIRKLDQWSTSEIEMKAKAILSSAMERIASSHATETTTTVITLPSEEMKGRIIGKEGRNIKAIEQITGTEIIIDDTPNSILVSGFNPIRRHLAKRALDKLILDGRIHPGRIEEAVEEAKKDLAKDILRAGEEAAYEVGIAGLDKKLLQILGRLKYRTSYGQNVLQHSIEVALLSKLLAQELGADVTVCVKGGLLHDIGKAVDHEVQGAHSQLGYEILKKYGLPDPIARIAVTHHEDNVETLEDIIVKTADAVSGARPGARKDTYENYIQRLQELENVASSFAGVEKVYAIQAGREVRIFVKPEDMDDLEAVKLARDVASKIEEELKYPGEIRVTVIRETRVVEYAR